MPLRKSPTPPHEQSACAFFAETVNLSPAAESGLVELSVGEPRPAKSQKRNCTENDERSLNVIGNTGCRWGRTWNVIDKTGG